MTKLSRRDMNRGYQQCWRRFPLISCEQCGGTERLHHHHKDRNPLNNEPCNIAILCQKCHNKEHLEEWRAAAMSAASGLKTCKQGEKNGQSKLTASQVEEIVTRRAKGEKLRSLANEFLVSESLISLVSRGMRWPHLSQSS